MTCRKGLSSSGASKDPTSLQPAKSLLNLAKAVRSGLSDVLLPLRPRKPHLLAKLTSSSSTEFRPSGVADRLVGSGMLGVLAFIAFWLAERSISFSCNLPAPPPRIADLDDWEKRGFLRMAEVTVMHSVVMRATGSMAMTGCNVLEMRGANVGRESSVSSALSMSSRPGKPAASTSAMFPEGFGHEPVSRFWVYWFDGGDILSPYRWTGCSNRLLSKVMSMTGRDSG